MIEPAAEAAPTVQGEAVSIDPAVEVGSVIWTAKLRTGRVVIFRASGSRAFRAVASIASVVAAVDLAVIDLAVAVDSVAIASVVAEVLGAVALAALVVEDSAAGRGGRADDEN